jgi:hypothetical protein
MTGFTELTGFNLVNPVNPVILSKGFPLINARFPPSDVSRYNAHLVITPATTAILPFHWQFNCPQIVV